MWKSFTNDLLGDLVLLGAADDDEEGDGGDDEKEDDAGGTKIAIDADDIAGEEGEEEGVDDDDDDDDDDEDQGAILNDISSGIEEAAALIKRGGNMIWSGMASAADIVISGVVDDDAALSGDDDEYYLEGGEDEEQKEEGGTTMGRMNSKDAENRVSGEDDVVGDEAEEEEEEEVLFLDVSRSNEGQGYSPARPTRKHAAVKLESLDVAKMRRRLIHAEEQRNMLMQTVESRHEEIYMLRRAMERRREHDITIRHLEKEVEWWEHLVAVCSTMTSSTTTNDSANARHVDSVNELKSILNQMRGGRGDADGDSGGGGIIRDSIKASTERIRELKSMIHATNNRKQGDLMNERDDPPPQLPPHEKLATFTLDAKRYWRK